MPTDFNCIQEIEFRMSFSRFTYLFKQVSKVYWPLNRCIIIALHTESSTCKRDKNHIVHLHLYCAKYSS